MLCVLAHHCEPRRVAPTVDSSEQYVSTEQRVAAICEMRKLPSFSLLALVFFTPWRFSESETRRGGR